MIIKDKKLFFVKKIGIFFSSRVVINLAFRKVKTMKVGIITHYDVHNHGAQLQLYALISQLRKWGIDAKALCYKKNYDFMGHYLETKYNISLRSIPFYIKYLTEKGVKKTFYNIQKKKILDNFRKKMKLVGEYYSEAQNLDVVVIGSDEIFSIEHGLNPCFWGMGVPCSKIISYAASFGPTTLSFIEKHNAEEFIKAGIEQIDMISVRDKNSQKIIGNYSKKDTIIVCDPVLLYDFAEERKINSFSVGKKKYCIIYSYDNNMNDLETVNSIKSYARKRGLQIFSIGYYHKWCDKNINVAPIEMFQWFGNAEMVFTDTFHGTVVSLVTNAQFLTKIEMNKNKLAFLLEQYCVSERCVDSFLQVEEKSKKQIDYTVINKRIEKIRKDSFNYLKMALGNMEKI